MTTSFTRTREQLATSVIRKLGLLTASGTAVSADMEIVYEAMDLRLKEMHAHGVFWRKVTKTAVNYTLSANNTAISASTDVLFPIAATVSNYSNDDPLDIIDTITYAKIENKALQGNPTKIYHAGSSSFLFWPVPITDKTIKLTYEKIADDTAASTAPDVEVSMLRALRDIVTYDVADNWEKPEATMQRWQKDAVMAERLIRKLNAPKVDYTITEMVNY